MCGIFGVMNLEHRSNLDPERFATALKTLDHRGPDARQIIAFGNDALLGHTRLAIIDLDSRSNQPLTCDDRYWITYNGEIYNFLELRAELKDLGHEFRTTSDTEVVLRAFMQWGKSCVRHFNGMWAFAIYDTLDHTIFCSRDRYGEKPFCYAFIDGTFLFASEIKAMLKYQPSLAEPDFNVISNFCRTSVGAQQPQTWFRQVKRLQAGHNLYIENGTVTQERYWKYPTEATFVDSFSDAQQAYRDLFSDSVRIRLRSDVPVGLTLSSGLDSSSIACVMHELDRKPHHFFSSSFRTGDAPARQPGAPHPIDESLGAGLLAEELGQNFHSVLTDYSDFEARLSEVIYHLESGNSSPATIPLMQLHRRAKDHVRVVLEGQGADELLGGYLGTVILPACLSLCSEGRINEAYKSLRQFNKDNKFTESLMLSLRDASNRFPIISAVHQKAAGYDQIYGPRLRHYSRISDHIDLEGEGGSGLVDKVLLGQHAGGLVNLLHYGDAISMAQSLESRQPFLDHRLVEFVWGLPDDYKVQLGTGKFIHRAAMRGSVPDRIIDQKVKFGYTTPISAVLRQNSDINGRILEILLSARCLGRGLFERPRLSQIIAEHEMGYKDHGTLLFRLLSVEIWFRVFIDTADPWNPLQDRLIGAPWDADAHA